MGDSETAAACIIQARTGSTRLPGKVLLPLCGKEVVLHVVERVARARTLDRIVVATTARAEDDSIAEAVSRSTQAKVFRGAEHDVLDRYYRAARAFDARVIVRITADCPLIDWQLIDRSIELFVEEGCDFVTNTLPRRTYPRGLDVEVLSRAALETSWEQASDPQDREHVTRWLRRHLDRFRAGELENEVDLSGHRWTLDEPADLELIRAVYEDLYERKPDFSTADVLELLDAHPELAELNRHVKQKPG